MWVCSIRTSQEGALLHTVYPTSCDWSMSVLGDGTATITFKIDDAERPLPADAHELFRPNATAFDLRWDDEYVAFFGKIESWDLDDDSNTITVRAVQLEHEWAWRMTYGVANYVNGTLEVNNRTISGAVARILERWMLWWDTWKYAVDLPADAPGSFSDPGWEYWKRNRIADLIQQIRDLGYEVYLRPYIASNGTTRLQTRVAPRITVGTTRIHLSAADKPISQIKYTVDGTRQITGAQGLGTGSGEDQPVAWAGHMDGSPIPIRDVRLDFPDLKGQPLEDATYNALLENREPTVQWSVGKFHIGGPWLPSHVEIGRVMQLESQGHPVIPDGEHMLRVIRARGTLGLDIRPEVQRAS